MSEDKLNAAVRIIGRVLLSMFMTGFATYLFVKTDAVAVRDFITLAFATLTYAVAFAQLYLGVRK